MTNETAESIDPKLDAWIAQEFGENLTDPQKVAVLETYRLRLMSTGKQSS
jgi:hypothetical protein